MSKSITEEQFVRALRISVACAKKKWQHSTDMAIAKIIGSSENKEEMIMKIEQIVYETKEEEKALKKMQKQFAAILKQEK